MIFVRYIQKMRQYRLEFNNHIVALFLISFICLLVIYILYTSKVNETINFNTVNFDKKINVAFDLLNKHEKLNLISPSCNFFTCFNVYPCGNKGNRLLVYVYPQENNTNAMETLQSNYLTEEFHSILEAIITSKYYTSNPDEACIFIPSIDMLNPGRRNIYMSHILNVLQFSENGRNHLMFNLMLENMKSYSGIDTIRQVMIAGIGHTKPTYRRKFDISLPALTTVLEHFQFNSSISRRWLLMSSQFNIDPDLEKNVQEMKSLFPNEIQIFHSCSQLNKTNQLFRCANYSSYKYPEVLQASVFCLVLRGEKLGLSILLDALATRCIPVIIFDSLIMPFDEVIDWSRAVVFIRELDILSTTNLLKKYSMQRIKELQNHGSWLYDKYFKSIKTITETTLHIIANRIFPHSARNYYFWNDPEYMEIGSPVFLPLTIPKNDGFTAIILTYDRIDLLFLLIHKLSKVPSLTKILIIWNNEYKRPPRLSKWPRIHKLMKIIQTEENRLSNRFYPFQEIETEAVLSIDDDIIMLTEDEIEFAFEVWREFPDRIVGFPSRTHTWDNRTVCWKYESEWTNRISMVLTGAAFYHKYWNYAYTVNLPGDIKKWVDNHMNCEDIAMNFLVSNVTKKAPIKVTAKKKFRCPECVNTEMLSADLTHMVERTQCINQFTKVFGHMPLKSVEFRADPVLFKDNFPGKLKRFNNVGSL